MHRISVSYGSAHVLCALCRLFKLHKCKDQTPRNNRLNTTTNNININYHSYIDITTGGYPSSTH